MNAVPPPPDQPFSGFRPHIWWSAALTLVILAGFAALLLFGADMVGMNADRVGDILARIQQSPWAFPLVAALYLALALTGFPQTLLIAATTAVFGAPLGAAYAWGSTMLSSAMTFFLGRGFGGYWVSRISADRVQALIRLMRRRGLVASMIIRWTPSAPFIVVNAVCGASGMAYWKFAIGTGMGIIPKIAIIAFFTDQLNALGEFVANGDAQALIGTGVALILWVLFFLGCRFLYQRLRQSALGSSVERTAVSVDSAVENGDSEVSLNKKSKAP
ncbi:MAG: VTT domain-containing protein [Pseudomonadota bacterium]